MRRHERAASLPGTIWQCRQRASYTSLAPTRITGSSYITRAVDQALGARSGRAAEDTNRRKFVYLFRLRHQKRHRTKRLAAKIHIETGDDNSDAAIREPVDHFSDFPVKELRFVNRDNGRFGIESLQDLFGVLRGNGFPVCAAVRSDPTFTIPRIESVRKNLDAVVWRFRRAGSAESVLPFCQKTSSRKSIRCDRAHARVHGLRRSWGGSLLLSC